MRHRRNETNRGNEMRKTSHKGSSASALGPFFYSEQCCGKGESPVRFHPMKKKKPSSSRLEKGVVFFLILILLIVFRQSLSRSSLRLNDLTPPVCEGSPLAVPYPYVGGFLEPHACAVQCQDGQQRYLMYSNGFATQCEKLPGCRDLGEDRGVICIPPGT